MEPNYTHDALINRGRITKSVCKKVRRLLLESLEIAIFLCNSNLKKFGFSQIFYIVNQILPTAYVVNSSYWVFYKCKDRPSACVCDRFKFKCLHNNNEVQPTCCIDLNKCNAVNGEVIFETLKKSRIVPSAVDVIVYSSRCDEKMMIKADIFIRLCFLNDFHSESEYKYSKQYDYKDFYLATEYKLHKEKEDAIRLPYIQFTPNPALHSLYGFYFKKLQNKQTTLRNKIVNSFTSGGITYGDNIPDYTISVSSVMLPEDKTMTRSNLLTDLPANEENNKNSQQVRGNKIDFVQFLRFMSRKNAAFPIIKENTSFSYFSDKETEIKGCAEKFKLVSSFSDEEDSTD